MTALTADDLDESHGEPTHSEPATWTMGTVEVHPGHGNDGTVLSLPTLDHSMGSHTKSPETEGNGQVLYGFGALSGFNANHRISAHGGSHIMVPAAGGRRTTLEVSRLPSIRASVRQDAAGGLTPSAGTKKRVQSVVQLMMTDSVKRARPSSKPGTPATPSMTTNALETMLSDFAVSETHSAVQQSTEL